MKLESIISLLLEIMLNARIQNEVIYKLKHWFKKVSTPVYVYLKLHRSMDVNMTFSVKVNTGPLCQAVPLYSYPSMKLQ